MAETTEEYRNRINQLKTSIENEPYIKEMREDIAEGISKTGNRQADIEIRQDSLEYDFVAVQQDARSNTPSGAELAVAAGEYNTLGERLDAEEQKVNAQLAHNYLQYEQTDFVELLKRYSDFEYMQIQKRDENTAEVGVFNLDKFINFTFASYGDDYWVQSYVTAGDFSPHLQGGLSKYWSDITRTGTWVNATEVVNGYTKEVGATFETTINLLNDNDGMMVVMNANSSGGMWEVTVDGEHAQQISVYSDQSTKRRVLLGRFTRGNHTVKGRFLGADPDHPVSDPRGWLNSTIAETVIGGEIFTDTLSPKLTFNTPSNKEFAFNIAPAGSNNFELVPYHGTATAFNVEPRVFFDGDKPFDFADIAQNEYKSLESFSLNQHIYGRNPESGSTNLIEVWTNQRVTKYGLLSIDGKMKVLQNIEIKNSYVIMGVAKGDLFTKVVSSVGNEYENTPDMLGQNTQLPESDFGKGYVFLSETNKDMAVAFRYNDVRRTLRQGGKGKDADPILRAYLQHRDSNILKLYNRLFDQSNLIAGDTHNFSGDYVYSYLPNAYDIFS